MLPIPSSYGGRCPPPPQTSSLSPFLAQDRRQEGPRNTTELGVFCGLSVTFSEFPWMQRHVSSLCIFRMQSPPNAHTQTRFRPELWPQQQPPGWSGVSTMWVLPFVAPSSPLSFFLFSLPFSVFWHTVSQTSVTDGPFPNLCHAYSRHLNATQKRPSKPKW